MKNCLNCEAPLYTLVAYCPYCGKPSAAPARSDAVPGAAAVAVAPTAAAPEPTPRPSPTMPPQDASPAKVTGAAAIAPPKAQVAPQHAPAKNPEPASRPSAAAPSAAPPLVPVPPKPSRWKWIVGAVLVIGVLVSWSKKSAENQAGCTSAIDLGMKAVLSGNVGLARTHGVQANALCSGAGKSKAEALQAEITKAEAAANVCQRTFNVITSALDEHKLTSARNALNQLGKRCAAEPPAKRLRQQLVETQTNANSALQAVRKAIVANDVVAARQALANLARENSEYPAMDSLNAEIEKLAATGAALATPAAAVELPAVAAPARTVPKAAPAPVEPRPARHEAAINPKAEMGQAFLRDAEAALGQRKFDAARTYLDSARRMDPHNPKIESLSQQIRERERQLLQQDTTIR